MIKMGSKADWYARPGLAGGSAPKKDLYRPALAHSLWVNAGRYKSVISFTMRVVKRARAALVIPSRLDDDSSMIKRGSKADWYARPGLAGGGAPKKDLYRPALAHSSWVNT